MTTAKNYLSNTEIDELNRIVVMWLDFAEDQAIRRKQVFLQDWTQKLDDFLNFNERAILSNAGSITKKQADDKAKEQYDKLLERRRDTLESKGANDTIKMLTQIAKKKTD